jgi:predicted nuclease of restriction endonuclease-like RecB superfamily
MEKLLSLDQEENLVISLQRDPTPTEIIELFNFHVLDTIFRQGYKLTFSVEDQVTGTLVKTFCMLAKRKGIVYDITQKSENRYHFTIYGPFEIFGKLTKYGFRLSEIALHFLAYLQEAEKSWTLEAELILYERKYLLQLTSQDFPQVAFFEHYKGILQESNPTYDSSVEAQFVRRFSKNTRGWTLENEPEPLLFDGNVMIPDFVATRGEKRVFIEVIGYWRPEYKKRKRKKLEQLDKNGIRMLLLIDKKFESDFPRTFSSHPIVFYS